MLGDIFCLISQFATSTLDAQSNPVPSPANVCKSNGSSLHLTAILKKLD